MKKEMRIKIEKLSKKFRLGEKSNPILEKIISLVKKEKMQKEFNVLDSIDLTALEGEIVGIIGKNGSGKSTLLRTIAKIYDPDSGLNETFGKVFYISGFDAGLMPKLTMKENIFLAGSILGLSQNNIKRKFNDIVEFSGLKEFINTKIEKFSSGMISRLNFSITVYCLEHQNPEILLLDEVFGSGGDLEFKNKATQKMEELIKKGATVILVSHDLEIIQKYCHRALLMENGKIVREGKPLEIIEEYIKNTKK
ncbi:MAG: ATP-binding cassette domain-containing protein [archaeon]